MDGNQLKEMDNKEIFIGKFIGQRIIKSVSDYSEEALLISFEDGFESIVSIHIIDKIASGEPSDATSLMNKRVEILSEEALRLFKKYNANLSEIDHVFNTVTLSINDSFNRSTDILWRTNEKTVLDIDRVLKSDKLKLSDIVKGVDN